MLKLTVAEKEYRVEFKHLLSYGKRPALRRDGEIKAMTMCLVSCENFAAMDISACDRFDNFSRREGRWRAFNKVLARCAPLRNLALDFEAAMLELDPEPEPVIKIVKVLSIEEKAALIEAGSSVRRMRAKMRGTYPHAAS